VKNSSIIWLPVRISFFDIASPKKAMQSRIISFFETYPLDETSVGLVQGTIGLYFIFLEDLLIPYPFKGSRLIYIGMSEARQNSIGNRLRDHRTGQSGNARIANYTKSHKVSFTYLGSEVVGSLVKKT